MVDAKEGKVDIGFFKRVVQKKEITESRNATSGDDEPEDMKIKYISGWILKFFGYFCEIDQKTGKLKKFNQETIEIDNFKKLSYQMIRVPIKIIDQVNKKEFNGKYEVGFIGCDKNEKNEVFPVKGWIFSILNKKKNEEDEEEENNNLKEKMQKMYREMEEDEDKYDNINDYYLRRIKFPYQYKNIDEIEQEKEEEEGEEEEEEEEN